jgi:hypothetical protein
MFWQKEKGTSFKPGKMLPTSALFAADSLPLGLNEADTFEFSSLLIY